MQQFPVYVGMASGVLRRSVQVGFSLISRRQNVLGINRTHYRKFSSSVTLLQTYFSEKHEWVNIPDGSNEGTVGITDYAQDKLGEVVFVQLPEIGQVLKADEEAGVLESVKAASDVFSPISGEVTAVNDKVTEDPLLINKSPIDEGWLYKMTVSDQSELEDLMNEEAYKEFCENEG